MRERERERNDDRSLIARHYRVSAVYFFNINYHNVQYLKRLPTKYTPIAGEVLLQFQHARKFVSTAVKNH